MWVRLPPPALSKIKEMRTVNFNLMFQYQSESGYSLSTIQEQVRECDPEYVEFLERKVEYFMKNRLRAQQMIQNIRGDGKD